MRNRKLYVALCFFLLSYTSFLIPTTAASRIILGALFYAGVISISEWITTTLAGKSLLREIRRSNHNILVFISIGALGGLLLDGAAKFLGKLWIYPDWSPLFYALIFIPGFAAYWLAITESYLAAKAILDYLKRGKTVVTKSYTFENRFFSVLGILGTIFSVLAVTLFTLDFMRQSLPLFTPANVYSSVPAFRVAFSELMLLFLGVWFFLEWLEFYRKKSSILKDIVHQYYVPLFAILFASAITSLFMEAQNIPMRLWVYTDWPMNDFELFSLPVVAFLEWPLHYVLFLSLFRALSDKESRQLWAGDLIR